VPDIYATITQVDRPTAAVLGNAMEVRARDPQQRAFLHQYLADLALRAGARVLEVGCGTGAICRELAAWPGVGEVVGADPSPLLLERARELAAGVAGLSFLEADGRALGLPDAAFDAVVLHTVLSHVPEPERVLAEAFRVLRAGGRLAVFDGDYATITFATGEHDPLEACAAAFASAYINDAWLVRRLPELVGGAGFTGARLRSHGFVQTAEPDYMLSIAARGADTLAATGRIGAELAEALKAEGARRVSAGAFFGHIAYASLIATRPA
jgi:SAM-dependent methyltransferase